MAADTSIRKNSELRRVVRKGINKRVLVYLIVGFFCVCIAFVIDICKGSIYEAIREVLGEESDFYAALKEIKQKLLIHRDKYCNLVMTLNTILAAAVIFYYSIQDNRRGGIPHRAILAYTFGSFTIPVLFVITLIMLPFYYVAFSFELDWTGYISLLFTYIIQMMIVIFILASTSYQYSVYAITNVEIRQFQALNEFEKIKQRRGEDRGSMFNRNAEQNSFFSWTYLEHHLEQVTVSEEMAVDKLLIARRILRVPYYHGEIKLRGELLETTIAHRLISKFFSSCEIKMSPEGLKTNNSKKVYEFYYGNLLAVFKHIEQPEKLEYRNKMYLILYEFLEELTELYDNNELKAAQSEESKKNYEMTVAGIVNAVLACNAEESEAFCNYVFNNIVSRDVWNTQISLYFLFQEYLYRTNSDAVRLENIECIEGVEKWINSITEDESLYRSFWDIWMEYTTILPDNSYCYYDEAIQVFTGRGSITDPVSYIMRIIGRKGGTYENKSDTND